MENRWRSAVDMCYYGHKLICTFRILIVQLVCVVGAQSLLGKYLFQLCVNVARCENLADLIWQNRQQIKKVELLRTQLPINVPTGCQDLLPILNTTITGLLSSLVTRSVLYTALHDNMRSKHKAVARTRCQDSWSSCSFLKLADGSL